MEASKIYSINLAAFLLLTTGIEPQISTDPSDPTRVFFLYPVSQSTTFVINAYRRTNLSVDLHAYLGCYRRIRQLMRSHKDS